MVLMSRIPDALKFTYEDCQLLPEDKQYELIDGELHMVPAPRPYHQIVAGRIEYALRGFARERHLGEVIDAPCDVYFTEHDVVQPDILFIAAVRMGIIKEKFVQGAPDLVVEILSPSTSEKDRRIKRRLYALHGVQEYWLVDPEARTVEVLVRQEGNLELRRTYTGQEELESPLLPGFRLSLPEIF